MIGIGIGYMALVWVMLNFLELITKKLKININSRWTCHKCLSFWITLIFTLDPFTAAIASISAYIFENKLKNILL
jgi:hypothetical protein